MRTTREQAVLDLVAEGRSDAEIGAELFLAAKSIERHVATITHKIGARSAPNLVSLAIGRGLLASASD